ncbi:MAG TPA: hypothetical protein VMW19_06200 [Myxococcota bacterium]|nr:hypothetical protein [Myxococcota bacterium]
MRASRIRVCVALLALAVIGAAAPEPEAPPVEYVPKTEGVDWPITGPKVFDAMVLRPLGFCATIVGIAAFPIAAPLAVFGPGVRQTWDTFVVTPVDFTFTRALGDF